MQVAVRQGSLQVPSAAETLDSGSLRLLDAAVQALQDAKTLWVDLSIRGKVAILDQITRRFSAVESRWVQESAKAKGIAPGSAEFVDEAAGPYLVMVGLRQLRQSLLDIERFGRPRIPGPVWKRPDGQGVAKVFPRNRYDRILYAGTTAEIWMEPGETLPLSQAAFYRTKGPGKVTLVLGAGNASSIGPLDALHKLFVEGSVVLYKPNPVNGYLAPLFEEAFRPLVERSFLRFVQGGVAEGSYLANHAGIDEVHITGSDKTFEAIVFGPGEEGAARKANRQPLLGKRVTGELGNVSPVIVVPGPWSDSDLAYQAEHIVSSLANNAGFNCNATRVIIQHAGWDKRNALLAALRRVLAGLPSRMAYYPGAQGRYEAFLGAHPEAEKYGIAADGRLPWAFAANLDPSNHDEICFSTEPFCGFFGETALEAPSIVDFIDRAVAFANGALWGTLNATILIHPATTEFPAVAEALDRAVADLRYGSVGVNLWAGISFGLGVTTWGGYPGSSLDNIQSGTGFVHNNLMFDRPQKSVVRGEFRPKRTPLWFVSQGAMGAKVFPEMATFAAAPSPLKLLRVLAVASKKPSRGKRMRRP